jgi:hypothetical protein
MAVKAAQALIELKKSLLTITKRDFLFISVLHQNSL